MENKLASRLTELLEENGLSKRKLAREIKVSSQSVSDWSTGIIQPTAENVFIIAKYFLFFLPLLKHSQIC